MKVVKALRNGQITIPMEFREALGIEDGETLLQLALIDGELRIKPVNFSPASSSSDWLQEVYETFTPVREELAKKYTEKEIDAAIDQAVKAVRKSHDKSSL